MPASRRAGNKQNRSDKKRHSLDHLLPSYKPSTTTQKNSPNRILSNKSPIQQQKANAKFKKKMPTTTKNPPPQKGLNKRATRLRRRTCRQSRRKKPQLRKSTLKICIKNKRKIYARGRNNFRRRYSMICARCKKHLCSLQICFFEVREKRFVRKSLRYASFPVAY